MSFAMMRTESEATRVDIFCKVDGQRLKIETPMRHFPEGSEEFVRFLFTFTADWSGLLPTTFAQFRQNQNVANIYLRDYTNPEDGKTYKSVYLPRTGVTGMTFEPGLLTMTLYGNKNERVIGTTNYVVMCLDPTGFIGGETSDMSETLYQQLVNRFIEYEWRYDIIQKYTEKFGNYKGAWEALVEELETASPLAILPATEDTLGGIKLDANDFKMGEGANAGKLFLKSETKTGLVKQAVDDARSIYASAEEGADNAADLISILRGNKDSVYFNRVHFEWDAGTHIYRIWGDVTQGAAVHSLLYKHDITAPGSPFKTLRSYLFRAEDVADDGTDLDKNAYLRVYLYDAMDQQIGSISYVFDSNAITIPANAATISVEILVNTTAGDIQQAAPIRFRCGCYACKSNAELEQDADYAGKKLGVVNAALNVDAETLEWEDGGFSDGESYEETYLGEKVDDPAFVRSGMISYTHTLKVTYPSTMRVGALYYTYQQSSASLVPAYLRGPTANLVISNKTGSGSTFHPAYLRLYAKWADGRPLTTEEAGQYILLHESTDRLDLVVDKEIDSHPGNMIMHGGRYWCDADVHYTREQRFLITNVIKKNRIENYGTEHGETATAEETAIFNQMVLCSDGDLEIPYWATRILIYNPDRSNVQIHSHNAGRWQDVLVGSTAEWIEKVISTREKKVMFVINRSDTYEKLPLEGCRVRLFYEATVGRYSISPYDAGLFRGSMAAYHPNVTTVADMWYLNIRGIVGHAGEYNKIIAPYQLNSIPYSAKFGTGGDVGFNRTFATFDSAVLNPKSKLYSEPGGVYDGVKFGGAATYYGSVCSTLAQMMLGFDTYYGSEAINRLCKHRRVPITDFRQVRPGMIMSNDGHEIIIIDAYHDASGAEMLDIYEASKPFMSASTITSAEFFKRLAPDYDDSNPYRIYDFISGWLQEGTFPFAVDENDPIKLEYGAGQLYYGDMPVRIKITNEVNGTNVAGVELVHVYSDTKRLVPVSEFPIVEESGRYAIVDITAATAISGRWWMYLVDSVTTPRNRLQEVPTEFYRQMHVSEYTPKRLATAAYATDVIGEYGNNTWHRKGEEINLYIKPTGQNEVTIEDTVVTIPTYPAKLYWRRDGGEWGEIALSDQTVHDSVVNIPTNVEAMTPGLYEFTTSASKAWTTAKILLLPEPEFGADIKNDPVDWDETEQLKNGETRVTCHVSGITPVYATVHYVTDVVDPYDFHDENKKRLKYIHSLMRQYPVSKSYAFYEPTQISDNWSTIFSLPTEAAAAIASAEAAETEEAAAAIIEENGIATGPNAPASPLTVVLRTFCDTGYGLTYFDLKFVYDSENSEWQLEAAAEEEEE